MSARTHVRASRGRTGRRFIPLHLLAAFGVGLAAACGDDPASSEEATITELASQNASLETLSAALEAAQLSETLDSAGPFTVFAPVDAAFDQFGAEKLDVLLNAANVPLLQKLLTYHVVPGEIRAEDLSDGATPTTVEGSQVTIDLSGTMPRIDGAAITTVDIEASNGVVHLIDAVLTDHLDIVDVAVINGFSTLVNLVQQAALEETLRGSNGGDGFTVFAPTDEAFAQLASTPSGQELADILTYHVVGSTVGSGDLSDGQVITTAQGTTFTVNIDGSGVTIDDGSGNTVSVVATDVPASNGVIHVIDGVLVPGS